MNDMNLQPLIDLAMKNDHRSRIRFIGWCDAKLPGVSITPAVAQQRVATLVVANLDYGPFPALAFDHNYQPSFPKRDEPIPEP